MNNLQLGKAIENYRYFLNILEDIAPSPSTKHVVDVLVSRDIVQTYVLQKDEFSTDYIAENLIIIFELDCRLKKQAELINSTINLTDWQASVASSSEAWWWHLKAPNRNRFDWLWGGLTVLCLTAALSFVTDISSRFLSGGPDVLGAFAVIIQSALTLLVAGGALTKAGGDAVRSILKNLKIPENLWHEARLGFAILLLLSLIGFRAALPNVAVHYNNRGFLSHKSGQLTSARFDYERSLKLSPDYAEAHYNLGILYEDLHDFERAGTEYQIAVQGSLDAAYNNLARIYILDANYSVAISLLLEGLDLAGDDVIYDMLKNLGWARLGQKRYAEAKVHLQNAIELEDNRAPAYCLLAQVLDAQGDNEPAQIAWHKCLSFASERYPDEDVWIGMARQHLRDEGEDQ